MGIPADATPLRSSHLTVSRDTIAKLTDQEAATLFFGEAAIIIAEFERPTHLGMLGPNGPIFQLRFATAPRRYVGGICTATVITLSFEPIKEDFWLNETPGMSRLSDLRAEPVYKFRATDGGCESAGRVLPHGSGDFGAQSYFFVDNIDPAAFRAAFSAAVEASRSTDTPSIMCETNAKMRNRQLCANPSGILQNLDLAALISVGQMPCPDDSASNCVRAVFVRDAPDQVRLSQQSEWHVTFPAALKQESGVWVARIGNVSIDHRILAID